MRLHASRGFTLIELLITILIIGILAAIGLAAYNGQRDKARNSDAKNTVRTALSAAAAYYTEHQTYDGLDQAQLRAIESSIASADPSAEQIGADDAAPRAVYVRVATANRHVLTLCANSRGDALYCVRNDMANVSPSMPALTTFREFKPGADGVSATATVGNLNGAGAHPDATGFRVDRLGF